MSKSQSIAIFGATSGIAIAFAQELASRAPYFFLIARDAQKLSEMKDDLLARGAAHVELIAADLGTSALAEAATERLLAVCSRLDVALIAHGILGDQAQLLADPAACRQLFEVNVLSPIAILNRLRLRFLEQKQGQLAVIGSVAGDRGRFSNYVYGSSKAALSAYCSGLRAELSHVGVQVLTIKPGMVATAMTAHLKRGPLMAEPTTVARAIRRALERRSLEIYTPWFWQGIMFVIRHLPERIFQRMKF